MDEREVNITVRVATISDGTHGIIMSAPDKVLGQWQDSRAVSLAILEDFAVSICGEDGKHRYRLALPGKPVKGEMLSETEAVITLIF